MKKILISLLVATFFIPFLVYAVEATTTSKNQLELEKISSPEQIKDFKVIKKEGNTLFGIRIQKLEDGVKKLSDRLASSTNKIEVVKTEAKKLEKINGPWETNLFEKIKQIGNALWGYKKELKDNLGTAQLTSDVVTCLKVTIDKKDTAVQTSLASSSAKLIKSVNDRNICQKASLDLLNTQDIIKAFKACTENFNIAVKENKTSVKKSRDEAWKTYQQEVKACYRAGGATTTVELKGMGEGGNVLLNDGGNNLDL